MKTLLDTIKLTSENYDGGHNNNDDDDAEYDDDDDDDEKKIEKVWFSTVFFPPFILTILGV